MADRASLDIEMSFGKSRGERKSENIPLIVVIGDFAGDQSDFDQAQIRRQPATIDDIDALIARLAPKINVQIQTPIELNSELTFKSIEDFHPDRIFAAVSVFQELKSIRQALSNRSTEQNGLDRLAKLTGSTVKDAGRDANSPSEPQAAESESEAVARLLGAPAGRNKPKSKATSAVDQFIKSTLGEAATEKPSISSDVGVQEIDAIMTGLMRGILRDDEFKKLESTWLGLEWLVRRVEEDQALIEVIDVPWTHLQESLSDSTDLENSKLARILCDVEPDEKPDFIVGLHTIERDLDHLTLMAKLGAISARAGAKYVTNGSLDLIGCSAADELDVPNNWSLPDDDSTVFWQEIQKHPVMQTTSVVAPRFVLRYPFGKATDAIDTFEFEELPVDPDHEAFCWGNPALLTTLGNVNGRGIVDDLPMPIYNEVSGQVQQHSIESAVSDRGYSIASSSGMTLLRAHAKTGNVSVQ